MHAGKLGSPSTLADQLPDSGVLIAAATKAATNVLQTVASATMGLPSSEDGSVLVSAGSVAAKSQVDELRKAGESQKPNWQTLGKRIEEYQKEIPSDVSPTLPFMYENLVTAKKNCFGVDKPRVSLPSSCVGVCVDMERAVVNSDFLSRASIGIEQPVPAFLFSINDQAATRS